MLSIEEEERTIRERRPDKSERCLLDKDLDIFDRLSSSVGAFGALEVYFVSDRRIKKRHVCCAPCLFYPSEHGDLWEQQSLIARSSTAGIS
jgi:hypothetical protein